MLDKNRVGLAFGLFLAVFHAVWLLSVAFMSGTLQKFFNWVFVLHAIEPYWRINTAYLSWGNALALVVLTFIVGYLLGFVFAWCHNLMHRKKR